MNVAVVRREIAGFVNSFGGDVVVSLSQCEQSPVGPTSRLCCRELRKLRELRVGLNVVTNLERRETDIECSHQLVVLRRRFGWQLWATGADRKKQHEQNRDF